MIFILTVSQYFSAKILVTAENDKQTMTRKSNITIFLIIIHDISNIVVMTVYIVTQ